MLPFSCGRHGNYCHPPCWSGLSHRLPAAPQPALSTAPGPHAEPRPQSVLGWDPALGGEGSIIPRAAELGVSSADRELCFLLPFLYPTTGMGFLHQTVSCSPRAWLKFTFTFQVISSTDSIGPFIWGGKDGPTNSAVPVSHHTRAGLGAKCWWLLVALVLRAALPLLSPWQWGGPAAPTLN